MESEIALRRELLRSAAIVISASILAGAWVYTSGFGAASGPQERIVAADTRVASELEEKVLPSSGVVLPVRWGDLGIKLASGGVIDREEFESLYTGRGGMTEDERKLLNGMNNENLVVTPENADFLLNLFWALGLGTKNEILDSGPMRDPRYGGAGNFASTGGWTLARGEAMDHFSRHPFIVLTPDQQRLVERVSENIYRPCCNNPVHFPDCNHGMAMLGLLELMASQGVSEEGMYRVALQMNAYWFPDTYLTIAGYLDAKNVDWGAADPKQLLGFNYSSGAGYQEIEGKMQALPERKPAGGCSA